MMEILCPVLVMAALGLLFGLGLGFASKKFHVEVDEKVILIKECLPGANCGGCGYAGCDAFAQAVVDGKAPANGCVVGGASVSENVANILGVEVSNAEPIKAFVKCSGSCGKAKNSGNYYGTMDCNEAAVIPGAGDKACSYGCLGLGSCVKACQFDAIHIVDGIALVDDSKCTGCGACTKACPKGLIELKPVSAVIRVQCNSKDKLKEVKDVCSVGCIGCGVCSKLCPTGAITMENNLPVVDKTKCTLCMTCVNKCPVKVIKPFGLKTETKISEEKKSEPEKTTV
ncbi:electron transport complex, RnfABCDGE type, B subunit [Hathewaya proteolytica DSM 3090]|uniref:Ion-translocating oxidoreductase complex subunit B n=1 Tax=Hathewaya proteolytica DSM 3090 TaxID=1121331 RepID=A0A1M6SIG4_9CLOT|nr:RnfABCDGE type electron transport complex subunit B [Hathewaya proteolytica]SHK44450.1 electron transport complex, RnfABCDGE type, B subunit [Hathewaya proteolytica DSM 3090]